MFKKIINKIIMGTQCYLALKDRFEQNSMDIAFCKEVVEQYSIRLNSNKTKARKINKLLNANFDKKNGTIKQIKALCNEIIKGE